MAQSCPTLLPLEQNTDRRIEKVAPHPPTPGAEIRINKPLLFQVAETLGLFVMATELLIILSSACRIREHSQSNTTKLANAAKITLKSKEIGIKKLRFIIVYILNVSYQHGYLNQHK